MANRSSNISSAKKSDIINSSNSSLNSSSTSTSDIKSLQLKKLIGKVKQSKIIFVGTYTERRLVQRVTSEYRDIVVVNKEEEDLIACLKKIQRVIHEEFGDEKWLGITCNQVEGESLDYNLWVELDKVPFGKHWFQMKSLKIKDNTVQLQLKYLRSFQATDREYLHDDNQPTFDLNKILTYNNMCEAIKFTAVLVMSIITLSGHVLWHTSNYSIKITRELSNLIRALTPVIFGFYELLSKCIGGIYWLIYMLFQGNSRGPIMPPPMAIMPNNKQRSYNHQNYYR
ncbi:hypothetical protein HCN44_002503 [Aphidius gifuensis]|uniref:Uncharacterized protein n=1 Tax=Aphidius gifuensis TaxID=684658 RepID=A0A835CUW1_APHGI|nr:uncharacterized protein LOC122860920 [Aphidius gifuensis]KAF7996857.1 hypothetical protein HCN44_002503 [Aphidius gifuensis]